MARSVRYQHRSNCNLITPYGEVELDENGHVTNLDKFEVTDLLSIEGFVDAEVFGGPQPQRHPRQPRQHPTQPSQHAEKLGDQGPSDEDYWTVIKDLTEKGGALNTEGYLQMEVLTAELRERGWPPISGTRRIRITDEHRTKEKEAEAPKPAADETPRP